VGLQRYAAALLKKGYSVRAYVIATVAVVLVPILGAVGLLATWSADAERAQLEHNAEYEARGITALLDHEILNIRGVLTALANSPDLRTENFEAFYHQASPVSRQLGAPIVLSDPNLKKQLVNTAVPWGTALQGSVPTIDRMAGLRSLAPGEVFVSDVFLGPVIKQNVFAVVMPVTRNGSDVFLLSVGVPTKKLTEILRNTQLPPQWIVSVIDSKNVIVARSEKHDEFSGTPIKRSTPAQATGSSGVDNSIGREGIAHRWAWYRSSVSGWVLAVGVPESVLNAPLRRALIGYGGAGSLAFILAMILSYKFGGRISQSIGALGVDRQPTRQEFEILFESAPNGVIVVDGQGLIVLINTQMGKKFGYRREELIGRHVEMLIPKRFRSGHSDLRKGFKLAPQVRPMGAGRDLFGERKDGSEFPIEIGLNPIRAIAGDFVMATVVDITARKRATEQISAGVVERDDLRRRLMQVQEDERLRLAHELHDQTGQSLAAVMLALKGLEPLLNKDGRDRMSGLRQQLDQMGKSLHHVAWELRPASIDELGLASGLANYVSEWSEQYGIEADFHCRDTKLDELPEEVRTTIYRVAQEGLTNIAKHALGATVISVVIDRADGILQLTIEDNGRGFDVASQTGHAGVRWGGRLGLAGMRERLSLIGAHLEIDSSIGSGTTIFVRIPLDRDRMTA
jgi:PAS domain S-box-containing protein